MKLAKYMGGVIATACFSALAAACGGIGAGDYAIYRIASPEAALSGDCNNNPDHTSTLLGGGTFVIYAIGGDGDDTFYLDAGGTVLKGAETDDGWAFDGKTTDVQDVGQNTTITHTTTYAVTVTDEGDQISGTYKVTDEQSCTGNGCGNNDNATCTATATFTGVMVDDSAIAISDSGNAQP